MIFVTADTVNTIYELIKNDLVYEEVLRCYFKKKEARDEFRQNLWLYFFEHPEATLKAYNGKYFKYHFISVVKNQAISNTKNWFDSYSKHKPILMEHLPEETEEINPFEEEELYIKKQNTYNKLKTIDDAIAHFIRLDPRNKPEMDMFKMYYYDHLTMREISKKLFNIPLTDVYRYIKSAEERIKWYIVKYDKQYNS